MKALGQLRVPLGVLVLGACFSFASALHGSWFVRGDASSNGVLSVSDAIQVLRYLFVQGEPPPACLDAADANDDGQVAISDATYLLSHLFLKGPAPLTPIRDCWFDTTADGLPCDRAGPCASMGLFFVVQRSGNTSQRWPEIQGDIIGMIERLESADQFGIAMFDANLLKFPSSGQPAEANAGMKEAAIAFVRSTASGSGTCNKVGLVQGLTYALQSSVARKQLCYFGSGNTTCPGNDATQYGNETLAEVKQRNTGGYPIHVFYFGSRDAASERWSRALAAESGGSFVRSIP